MTPAGVHVKHSDKAWIGGAWAIARSARMAAHLRAQELENLQDGLPLDTPTPPILSSY